MSNTTDTPTYAKGSWQDSLQQSSSLLDRSTKARKRASQLLWTGATTAINAWLPNVDDDVTAETFYGEVLEALGTPRKGDASKIKTVALAVAENGLVLDTFENLSKAYAEATRLRKTEREEKDEDDAAEAALALIEAPKSTSSVDGAAALLLSKGLDGAIVAILDALGKDNFEAHRAFMRAVGVEVRSRIDAVAQAEAKVRAEANAKVKAEKEKAAKEKAAAAKKGATAAKKATPAKAKASASKAKPARAKAPVVEEIPESVEDSGVTEIEDDEPAAPAPKAKARRAVPVRRAGQRG